MLISEFSFYCSGSLGCCFLILGALGETSVSPELPFPVDLLSTVLFSLYYLLIKLVSSQKKKKSRLEMIKQI